MVKLAQYSGLWVDGHLEARGTAVLPIHVTDWRDDEVGSDANGDGDSSEPAPGWWRGLYVRETGSASLAHGTLRYAGYLDGGGLFKSGAGDLTMSHWTLSKMTGYGLKLENSAGATLLQQSTFADNGHSGLYLKASPVTAIGCSFTGNDAFGVHQEASDGLPYADQQFLDNGLGSVGVNGGVMAVDRTWSRGGGTGFTVVVRGSLTVPPETTLTVEPGVVVQFVQYVPLTIQGVLSALGTADLPVRFQGATAQTGWWRGIQLTGAGSAHLEYCEVAHAGYLDSVGILASGTGALTLRHSTLREHTGDALRLAPGNGRVTAQNNVFRDSTRGVRLGLGATWDDVTSDFAGNTVDLWVDAGTVTDQVVWGLKPDYSMYLSATVTVAETARLTVRPGTVLKVAQYAGIYVDGQLEASGTAALPIVFTDWRDDTVGGDANRDGADSAAAPGWWRGLFVRGPGSALLRHGTARYAGYLDAVGVAKTGSGALTVRDWTVAHMQGHGLRIADSTGTTQLDNVTLQDNTHSGLYLKNGSVMATGCAFTGNAQYGVLQEVNDGLDYATQHFAGNGWGSVGVNAGSMTTDRTWSRGGGQAFTMAVRGPITVSLGATLTLDPGVTLQFAQYVPLYVQGALAALGTADQPILFHGATGQPGWWRGIQLTGSGSAQFGWCDVAHAGYLDGVGLSKAGSGALSLRYTTSRNHQGDGLRLNGSTGSHQIEHCRFAGNTHGIRLQNLASPLTLGQARIEDNSALGIRNDGPADVDARQAWWGHATGPQHATLNPEGLGNPVSDRVLFEPWNTGTTVTSLQVVLEPAEARAAGAQWSVDGATWHESGLTLTLDPGTHTVQYNGLNGWTNPSAQNVILAADEPVTLTATYTAVSGPETTFAPGPLMNQARMAHHLATLPDGRVVLFGGHGTGFTALNSAEIWNPSTDSFTTLTMQYTHDWAAFTALTDGRLLLAGGSANLGIPQYATSELFDPATGAFTAVGDLVRFRSGSGAAALTDGTVLIAGAWWTHNDAHTYGEVFNPATGTFTATGALNTRRAHPVVLPTANGGAVVLGGTAATGGSYVSSVERFDPLTREFSEVQPELFAAETGWGLVQESRPISQQRLGDGRYLLLASRTQESVTRYRLFTFDPQTAAIAPVNLTTDLPDSRTYTLWTPVVDADRGRAHLLAQTAGSNPPEVRLFTVELAAGALTASAQSQVLDPAYVLYGAGITLLTDGRMFVTGGSADGSNFNPVRHTLLVTPPPAGTAAPSLGIVGLTGGQIELVWSGEPGAYILQESTNLIDWTTVSAEPGPADAGQHITVPLDRSRRFFRLLPVGQ